MDRFSWTDTPTFALEAAEQTIAQQTQVRLYDGEEKTTFDNGIVTVTSRRLAWDDTDQRGRVISLNLALVKNVSTESAGMFKSAKVVVHLLSAPADKPLGPKKSSSFDFVKLSFRSGGDEEMLRALRSAISKKEWEQVAPVSAKVASSRGESQVRHAGIGGIERRLEEKYKKSDDSINEAFKDLDALMTKAKDMVAIAERFSSKLREKQISITDDETVQFKSYLLSMGIENPVTRETHGSGAKYHEMLGKELASFVSNLIDEDDGGGGVMTLSDVYCRFNRARGMELISPDDVLQAANLFERLGVPLRVQSFESGVLVIKSLALSEEELIARTLSLIESDGPCTAEELSRSLSIALSLARERLLMAERAGQLCRDDSVEGIRFYPNRFLEEEN